MAKPTSQRLIDSIDALARATIAFAWRRDKSLGGRGHPTLTQTYRFRVEKLIRDKLPAIMRASDLRVFERTLEADEFIRSLEAKLAEEAAEVAAAEDREERLDELVDVMEVSSPWRGPTISPRPIGKRGVSRNAKVRGGFDARIYNAAVEADEDCPALAYYLARPKAYPRH